VALPFDPRALTYTAYHCLTSPASLKPRSRRVRLSAQVRRLGLDPQVAEYVRAIAGTHYLPQRDLLVVATDQFPDAGRNRRQVLEQVVGLVSEAQRLLARYGPVKRPLHFPPYA